jgi:hypothetical protein
MDAARYLAEIVIPTVQEYADDPRSVRRGFLACVATFHIIDYMAKGEHKDVLRQRFKRECPSYKEIDRIAHAFKHAAYGLKLKAGDVVERPPFAWRVGRLNLSRWRDTSGGVTLLGKTQFDLLVALNATVAYLQDAIQGVAK